MKWILLVFLFTLNAFAKVLPIAHRGASAYAPENTMSAINKAIELNSQYIEIDVHMTKDGEIVALHDTTIDRTSNGQGNIRDFTLAELKELDFGSWFGADFQNEKIPTLKEVLQVIQGNSILIIELKYGDDKYPQMEKKIVDLIKEMNKEKNVILKSFSYKILNKFEQLAPQMERLYCTFWGNNWLTIDNFLRLHGIFGKSSFQYLQVHKFFLSKKLIEQAHKRKIKVIVWDVHDRETMRKFVDKKVDFIESDNPDYVLDL